MMIGAWIWGLVTVLSGPQVPIQVNIVDGRGKE